MQSSVSDADLLLPSFEEMLRICREGRPTDKRKLRNQMRKTPLSVLIPHVHSAEKADNNYRKN